MRAGVAGPPAGVADLRVLDLHHIRPHPRQRFSAGRPRLELGQIQDLQARKAVFSAHVGVSPSGFAKSYARHAVGVESGSGDSRSISGFEPAGTGCLDRSVHQADAAP